MHTNICGLKQPLPAGWCTLRALWEGLELGLSEGGALLALGLDLPFRLQEKAHTQGVAEARLLCPCPRPPLSREPQRCPCRPTELWPPSSGLKQGSYLIVWGKCTTENTPLTSCKNSLLLPLNSHISRRSLLRWKDSSCSVSSGEVRNLLYQEGVEKASQRVWAQCPTVQPPGGPGAGRLRQGTHTRTQAAWVPEWASLPAKAAHSGLLGTLVCRASEKWGGG